MLFSKQTYVARREALRSRVGSGLIVLLGNNDTPMNYPANAYKRRQDSSFLYFTGQHRDALALVMDCEAGRDVLVGDEIDIDDIVWYGSVVSVREMGEACGVHAVEPFAFLEKAVREATAAGRSVHFLPAYRHDHKLLLQELGLDHRATPTTPQCLPLIRAIVALRSVKTAEEIEELERASHIGFLMHTTAMRLCRPGVNELYISGLLEGVAASYGSCCSFQNIVTTHGEILHGAPKDVALQPGRLLLVDAGAETLEHYCSDHTRTMPVSGRFTSVQRDVYNIVVRAHDLALTAARPGVRWMDVHLDVCRVITEGLKALGLMKGDTEEAVHSGAHALFLPHGLGHMMGMDVHDMEGLGQINVGYDEETRPSTQWGTSSLRFGRRLEVGHVVTDEPGIYFIPDLIEWWKEHGTGREFLNFPEIEKFKDFGGIRIEDDVLITPEGCRFLGTERIPYAPEELEAFLQNNIENQ